MKRIAIGSVGIAIFLVVSGCSFAEPKVPSTSDVQGMDQQRDYRRYMLDGDSALTFRKDYDEAIKQYKSALEVKPGDPDATEKIAKAEADKDQFLASELDKQVAEYQAKKEAEKSEVVVSEDEFVVEEEVEQEVVEADKETDENSSNHLNQESELSLGFSDFYWEKRNTNSEGWTLFSIEMQVSNNSDTIQYISVSDFIATRGDYAADPYTFSDNPASQRILPGGTLAEKVFFSVNSESIDGFVINYVEYNKLYPVTVIKE